MTASEILALVTAAADLLTRLTPLVSQGLSVANQTDATEIKASLAAAREACLIIEGRVDDALSIAEKT